MKGCSSYRQEEAKTRLRCICQTTEACPSQCLALLGGSGRRPNVISWNRAHFCRVPVAASVLLLKLRPFCALACLALGNWLPTCLISKTPRIPLAMAAAQ